ncbi:Phosphoinositide phospholipase C [Meloidogyne graminicola]|uniref:Phosphoinositide phospholipase C n=1 Tax=Meloidogyne graminicola TaxID=189291 RepID=A0A8S9ZDA9_9BILA|nr:Phosphoinositide phospholipase C [Meloidogyne graminicola]
MLQQPQPQHFDKNSPLRSSLRKHRVDSNGKQQRSPSGRKNVSFCSSQNAENKRLLVSNVTDCFAIMQSGTELIKLRTNVRQFRRIFSLDEDMAYIRWTPSNKKPHKARISINSIKEVRIGWNSELLKLTEPLASPEINEECAFSIIHGDEHECLDLIALNASDANIWITGLIALANGEVSSIKELNINSYSLPANLRERWLSLSFKEVDQDNKGYISEKSAVRLIRSLNNRLLISRIKQKVKEASINLINNEIQRGKIDEIHFIDIYKDLATRPEIYFLMVRYANKDYLNINDLKLFLETEQGLSSITTQFCENIIDQCEPSLEAKELNIMTVDGFTNFLNSQLNSIFDSEHLNVCQNMEKHFSNYFISTSFNTYLVEDQLRGPSSLDGYISALKRNCRYIELDIWEPDDGGGDEPVLFNGGTLTSKLPLGPVLDIINEMAFERTKFPLFIRLELHLYSIDWQYKLLNLLELKLGNRLFKPKLDQIDWNKEIPTPKKFLNKIILSGPYYEGNELIGEIEEENESSDLLLFNNSENNIIQNEKKFKKNLIPLIKEIKDLIAPFAIFGRINEPEDIEKFSPLRHIISISETDCIQFVNSQQPNYLFSSPKNENSSINRLIRVFPSPQRIDSSNLNPQEFWNFGCQFVALNYQTPGLMMDLQEGKFLANGGCGYVLKPLIMNKENNLFNNEINNGQQLIINNNNTLQQQQILNLKIISAQQLPRPRASTAKV